MHNLAQCFCERLVFEVGMHFYLNVSHFYDYLNLQKLILTLGTQVLLQGLGLCFNHIQFNMLILLIMISVTLTFYVINCLYHILFFFKI